MVIADHLGDARADDRSGLMHARTVGIFTFGDVNGGDSLRFNIGPSVCPARSLAGWNVVSHGGKQVWQRELGDVGVETQSGCQSAKRNEAG